MPDAPLPPQTSRWLSMRRRRRCPARLKPPPTTKPNNAVTTRFRCSRSRSWSLQPSRAPVPRSRPHAPAPRFRTDLFPGALPGGTCPGSGELVGSRPEQERARTPEEERSTTGDGARHRIGKGSRQKEERRKQSSRRSGARGSRTQATTSRRLALSLRAELRRARDLAPSEQPQAEALERLTEQPAASSYSANDDKTTSAAARGAAALLVGTACGKDIIFDNLSPAYRPPSARPWRKSGPGGSSSRPPPPSPPTCSRRYPPTCRSSEHAGSSTAKTNGTAKARL